MNAISSNSRSSSCPLHALQGKSPSEGQQRPPYDHRHRTRPTRNLCSSRPPPTLRQRLEENHQGPAGVPPARPRELGLARGGAPEHQTAATQSPSATGNRTKAPAGALRDEVALSVETQPGASRPHRQTLT